MRYPKTIAAAGKESKGLKELAAALWEEIPPGTTGGTADVATALESAQSELIAAGHTYAVSRLRNLRNVAGWAFDPTSGRIDWRDTSFSIHEEAYNLGWNPERLDKLLAESETLTVSELRGLAGKKKMTRGPRTTVEQEFESATEDERKSLVSDLAKTTEGRKAIREAVAEDPILVKDIQRRRSVLDQVGEPKPKKEPRPPLDEWELWTDEQRADFDKKIIDSVRHLLNAQLLKQRGYRPSADADMHLQLIRPSDLDADLQALLEEVEG